MTKKIMLFNAPPNAGKDFAVDYLERRYRCNHVMFKQKLYELLKVIYNLSDNQLTASMIKPNKEYRSALFDGLTPRQALIRVSEEVIKPNFGKDYFTKDLVKNLDDYIPNVSSDCGFDEEIESLVKLIGSENIFVVKVHRDGYTFLGDSRKYISSELLNDLKIKYASIKNDDDYLFNVDRYYNIFF